MESDGSPNQQEAAGVNEGEIRDLKNPTTSLQNLIITIFNKVSLNKDIKSGHTWYFLFLVC